MIVAGRKRFSFILTNNVTYMCKYCGLWQLMSSWNWLALWHCKRHERKCEGNGK